MALQRRTFPNIAPTVFASGVFRSCNARPGLNRLLVGKSKSLAGTDIRLLHLPTIATNRSAPYIGSAVDASCQKSWIMCAMPSAAAADRQAYRASYGQ